MSHSSEIAQHNKQIANQGALSVTARQQAFVEALQEAERKYGFVVISTIEVDGLGPVTILGSSHIKPGPVSIAAVEGWQPRENSPEV